jgi:hypothetical protein
MEEFTQQQAIVAVYCAHAYAQAGIKTLHKAGVDMRRLSLMASDSQRVAYGHANYSRGVEAQPKQLGACLHDFWTAAQSTAPGNAHVEVLNMGPIVLLGPLVSWTHQAHQCFTDTNGADAWVATLLRIGIPPLRIFKYALDIQAGKVLLLGSGDAYTVKRMRSVLRATCAAELTDYSAAPIQISYVTAPNSVN